MKRRRLTNRKIHFRVELANLTLERQRTVILMFTPAHDMTSNHLAGPGYEFEIRMLLSQLPRTVDVFNDVCIADVGLEVFHTLVEVNDVSHRDGAFNRERRRRRRI